MKYGYFISLLNLNQKENKLIKWNKDYKTNIGANGTKHDFTSKLSICVIWDKWSGTKFLLPGIHGNKLSQFWDNKVQQYNAMNLILTF